MRRTCETCTARGENEENELPPPPYANHVVGVKKYFEKDAALARRSRVIKVEEAHGSAGYGRMMPD